MRKKWTLFLLGMIAMCAERGNAKEIVHKKDPPEWILVFTDQKILIQAERSAQVIGVCSAGSIAKETAAISKIGVSGPDGNWHEVECGQSKGYLRSNPDEYAYSESEESLSTNRDRLYRMYFFKKEVAGFYAEPAPNDARIMISTHDQFRIAIVEDIGGMGGERRGDFEIAERLGGNKYRLRSDRAEIILTRTGAQLHVQVSPPSDPLYFLNGKTLTRAEFKG